MSENQLSGETQKYKIVGTEPTRDEDVKKLTGQAVYGIDTSIKDMLYGTVLRSPHAHARILHIDTHLARSMHGVKAVITAADWPDLNHMKPASGEEDHKGLVNQRDNLMAANKVLYDGHAVAAVAATSLTIAEQALSKIQVSYDVLEPVLDVDEALRDNAPILHPDLRTDDMGVTGEQPTNLASHSQYKNGDPELGFSQADIIVEHEYHTATVHQGYIEPHNATATWDPQERLTIWVSTQGSFAVREEVAQLLQIPEEDILVIPLEVGGGFGGKNRIYLEPLAALLSKKSGGLPVKMVMSQREVLAATGPTSASTVHAKLGVDQHGKITAATARLIYAAGAFPGSPLDMAAMAVFAPYHIENIQVDTYDVVVNRPKSSTYRAPGNANAVFATESIVDEVCEKLGMDPLEFRRVNGVKEGDHRLDGYPYKRIGFIETLEAARHHPHYLAPLTKPNQGRGVASCMLSGGSGRTSASAALNPDGTVTLLTGSVDLTGTRLTQAMQLAETLGMNLEDVKASVADTDSASYTDGSWGSRTAFSTGWVMYEIGQQLISQCCQLAAGLWGVPPDQIHFESGIFSCRDKHITIKDLAGHIDPAHALKASTSEIPHGVGPAFTTHIVDVEVDPDTGQVQVLRYTAIQDVGRAIHPGYVAGQIRGSVTQGIGWALNEEYVYDESGHLLNGSFLDYRIPTCMDVPAIDTVILEVPNPTHPYGVRGVGEISIVPPPAAIANAIHAAVGVRMDLLPMSPPHILEALWNKHPVE